MGVHNLQLIIVSCGFLSFFSPRFCRRTRIVTALVRDLATIFNRIIVVFLLSPFQFIIWLGFALVIVICSVILVSGFFFLLAALKGLDTTINGGPKALNVVRGGLRDDKDKVNLAFCAVTNKASYLRKQVTFHDANNSFPAKSRIIIIRKGRRNSIIITCHHPDLASEWLK